MAENAIEGASRTAERFATEWKIFKEIEDHHRQQFLDWIAPIGPDDMRGKAVFEGGCGKGRHSRLLGEWAGVVVSVDLGEAVEVAFENTRSLPNVHIVQTDLLNPGVADRFDLALSVGVLHHLTLPEEGFKSLVALVRPGGRVSTWTYGRENNGWIVYFVDPLRRAVTSRLSSKVLLFISSILASPVWLASKIALRWPKLPYSAYLSYVGKFPFREIRHIVYDQLTPPISHYLPREEIEGWYECAGLEEILLTWHNKNSWRATGTLPI